MSADRDHSTLASSPEDRIVRSLLINQSETFDALKKKEFLVNWDDSQARMTEDEEYEASNQSMLLIGEEMHKETQAFSLGENPEVLDLCRVPCGFKSTILKYDRQAEISAVALYLKDGGHVIATASQQNDECLKVSFKDVAGLANELGISNVPGMNCNSDIGSKVSNQARASQTKRFDLVICDGVLPDTHNEPVESNSSGAMHLRSSQLILALGRIKSGGTLIIRLNKLDTWTGVRLVHVFGGISSMKLFKSAKLDTTISTCYIVARNVDISHHALLSTLREWKEAWKDAFFSASGTAGQPETKSLLARLWSGGRENCSGRLGVDEAEISRRVVKSGIRVLEEGIWSIQGKALKEAHQSNRKRKKAKGMGARTVSGSLSGGPSSHNGATDGEGQGTIGLAEEPWGWN